MANTQVSFGNADIQANGNAAFNSLNLGTACLTDAMMAAPTTPASAFATTKLRHRTIYADTFNADSTTTAATVRKAKHVVKGTAGTIVNFDVGAVTAALGGATVTIKLLKNGTTVLSGGGTMTLDSSSAAYALVAAAFASTAVAAGDVLEIQITAATTGGGTLPAGVFFRLVVDEDPS